MTLAARIYKVIVLYLETIEPLIAKLSLSPEFKQLEGYRRNLLEQMEILNILPVQTLKTSAEVSVHYEREEIDNLLKTMVFCIKRSYFNPAYNELLKKIDKNQEKIQRLEMRQQRLNSNLENFKFSPLC